MNAQEIKPTVGDVATEFGVTGGILNTDIKLANSDAFFKARYFNTDKLAYRVSFSLNTDSDKNDIDAGANATAKTGENYSNFLIGFGLEKHFTGTDRLSPYVGGEFLLGFDSNKKTHETNNTNGDYTKMETKGPNSFGFGARGVFGADYYFAKKVFLGVEAGLQLMYVSNGKTTTTTETKLGSSTTTTNTEIPGGSNFNISSSVITGLRIGFVF
ncbi:hypothetical protein [Bergeyella zoohelcum]|uniref:hypothetical protein n=1 Tax=Bergeyella zoohelcum TaxID=1015 RepID=UPI002A90CBD2|nr:hypothetical protein [Bergeyella zoohelcum]MDY6025388.1 hypothetical protein [Bergeyella zoohelcum]